MNLFERICWAQENLNPVQSNYRIVYEDPAFPDDPVKIVSPAPEWMAMALHGRLLPPISSYLDMPLELITDDDQVIICTYTEAQENRLALNIVHERVLPYHTLHTAEPVEAMSEEQAIEYLLMKDVPARVWCSSYKYNRPMFRIVGLSQIPTDRTYRNGWKLVV